MKQTKYRINGITEETNCDQCGMPLDHGDKAILGESIDTDGVFCSESCCKLFFSERHFALSNHRRFSERRA